MRTHSFRLFKLMAILLIAGAAIVSGLQLQADAAELLFCGNTGQPCDDDGDCTGIGNPTCFCAIIEGATVGVCREDLDITKK